MVADDAQEEFLHDAARTAWWSGRHFVVADLVEESVTRQP
jgi:hypothetical protein